MRPALAGARDEAVERLLRRSHVAVGFTVVFHEIAARTGDLRRELVPAHGSSLVDGELRFLKERYAVVLPSELPEAVATRRPGERLPVAITFDDDLRSHVEQAQGLLRRHRLPAGFFLGGVALDGPHAFWWDRLQTALDRQLPGLERALGEPLPVGGAELRALGERIEELTPGDRAVLSDRLGALVGPPGPDLGLRRDDIVALHAAGFEIGFHTLRHDPLPPLDDDALAQALTAGREELGSVLGTEPSAVAYPHGRADRRVAAAARAAGYVTGFTTEEAPVLARSDPLLLPRFTPSFASVRHFASQITKRLLVGAPFAWRT